ESETEPQQDEPILSGALSDRINELASQESSPSSVRQKRAVAQFQSAVRGRIQERWLVPPGLESRGDLEAVVRIKLTPAGELAARPKVVTSNGPGHFNSSVVRAVEKAAPFPMPDGPTGYFQDLKLKFSPDMIR
ncbi:MAG TPA: energy transducer TonB, partial [Gammaproteobacteria bacterium]|nr:energy transducer TonB [Gammaproteobacteria bacterium]